MIMPPAGTPSQLIRLYSGLILLVFAGFHFVNHSLGLISLDIMASFQEWREAITRSLPGSIVLMSAIIVHPVMAMAKLAFRSTLKMKPWEAAQILLGLSIPFLLIPHFVNTRMAYQLHGLEDDYVTVLGAIWPDRAWQQSLLLLLVWVHGCIGLHFWLRITSWYRKALPALVIVTTLIPALGIAGFTVAGRMVAARVPAGIAPSATRAVEKSMLPGETVRPGEGNPARAGRASMARPKPARAPMKMMVSVIQGAFYSLLGLSLVLFGTGLVRRRLASRTAIAYTGGPTLRTPVGPTLLEISRMHGIPHAAICGGRARCSTCRVHVHDGLDTLPPPGPAEAATLNRVRADADVRLACQIRPEKPLGISLVVRPSGSAMPIESFLSGTSEGTERNLVIMFMDVRGFTALSADKLPYDVVFLLNQLFESVGAAINAEKGWIDKYLGDGLMAVFGRDCDTATACHQALRAARAIDLTLDGVNEGWKKETGENIRIGMGIHVGPLVMGRIGASSSAALTVIGRVVNTAARLEALTKEKHCQLIVSAETAELAGLDNAEFTHETVTIRGLAEPLDIVVIPRARELPYQGNS